jgi:FkbM family methyltransferase
MKTWIRHFLPFGLVRASQLASEFARLGLARSHALRRQAGWRLQSLNLNLLPTEALAGPPATVVDVGANTGDWSAGLLNFYTPDRLICVEPDPKLAAGLRDRFAARSTVQVVERAVGSTPGTAELKMMEDSVCNSLRQPTELMKGIYPSPFRVIETVQVEVQTLDALLADVPRVKLLKIDVQGFEREVLEGAAAVLRRTDFVLMEVNFKPHYDGEAGFLELDTIMQRRGFAIGNYSAPKGGKREALYADVLYLRPES